MVKKNNNKTFSTTLKNIIILNICNADMQRYKEATLHGSIDTALTYKCNVTIV